MNKPTEDEKMWIARIVSVATILTTIAICWYIVDALCVNADAQWAEQLIELQRISDANWANISLGK